MCKHKSGGMNKPSGTNSHDGLSERTTSSAISSQDCPQSTTTPPVASTNQNNLYALPSAVMAKTTAGAQPSSICPSSTCDTYSFLPSNDNPPSDSELYQNHHYVLEFPDSITSNDNPPSDSKLYQNNHYILEFPDSVPSNDNPPSDSELYQNHHYVLEFPDSVTSNDNPPRDSELYQNNHYVLEFPDSEDDTEHSPMLLKDGYEDRAKVAWNPESIAVVLRPDHFDSCDSYTCSGGADRQDKATNCDNFSLYHNLRPLTVLPAYRGSPNYFESTIRNFDERQRMDFGEQSYGAKQKKKWLLNQNKCKSADSEPDTSFNRHLVTACRQGLSPVSYNYVQGQGANVLQTHMDGCQSYVKPVYQNNGDPIPGPSGLQRPCSINWELGGNNLDSEFRSRSYSLTPTVNFAVFESESSSETEDVQEPMVPEPVEVPANCEINVKTMDDPFELPVMSLGKVIPISPSAAQLSIASSYGDNGSPICKICHMTARENDPLISPCRCSGTMQYIHCGCLMRWLEVCHKRGRRPASCELCQYQYHWHKKFKIRHWQFPQCSRKDKLLHLLFILSVLLMVTCASLTVMFFKQDKPPSSRNSVEELTQSEIGNLVCGVLFFVAFFVAIYVEAKSHHTLYKLIVRFIHINQQWYIDEYEKKETSAPPVAV